jgi:hypothetical protein
MVLTSVDFKFTCEISGIEAAELSNSPKEGEEAGAPVVGCVLRFASEKAGARRGLGGPGLATAIIRCPATGRISYDSLSWHTFAWQTLMEHVFRCHTYCAIPLSVPTVHLAYSRDGAGPMSLALPKQALNHLCGHGPRNQASLLDRVSPLPETTRPAAYALAVIKQARP